MKTLYTIYTNFAKRLVMSLIVLMTVGVGSVFAAQETLSGSFTSSNTTSGGFTASGGSAGSYYKLQKGYIISDASYSVDATKSISVSMKVGTYGSHSANKQSVDFYAVDKNGNIISNTVTASFSQANSSGATFSGTITLNSGNSGNDVRFKFASNSNATSSVCARFYNFKITYESAPSTFTVTYDDNGATGGTVPTDGNAYESGTEVTVLGNTYDLVKTGYRFDGWQIDKTGTVYNAGDKFNISANTTLYAIWTARELTNYRTSCTIETTVTLDPNGGTISNTDGWTKNGNSTYSKIHEGIEITLPTATKNNYIFGGWYNGETKYESIPSDLDESITLTAKWLEKQDAGIYWDPESVTVTIDADGNTLPVFNNPNEIEGITFSSSNSSVVAVDANGVITLGSTGTTATVTITATFDGNETYAAKTVTCSITVHPSNCKWVETEIDDIQPDDEVLITMKRSDNGNTYTLDHSNGTSALPPAQIIAINGNEATFLSLYHSNSIWNISGNPTDGYILYPNGSTTTWLYCTKSNKNVKVGTTTNNVFAIDNGYLKHTNTTESWIAYLGVYINGASTVWHHENSPTAKSIADQTLKFYKRECLDASKVWVEGNLTNVTCDQTLPQQLAKDGSITLTFAAADGYALPNDVTVTNATKTWDKTNGKLTISNPTGNVMVTVKAVKYYTVTWKPAGGNWSGDTNDKVVKYEAGDKIVAPATPTYDCHEFLGWTPAYPANMTMPAENLEFTATWNKLSHTITFKNYNGTVLQTSTVECGETPTYTGAAPTREQTAQYTYAFSGWSPDIAPATQDQVYTAKFDQTTRSYTVTWYDGTGNAHKTQTANYNATISVPTTDPEPCDNEYPHFIGWTADPIVGSTTTKPTLVENVKVTGDCDYYPVFAKGEGGSSNYQKVTSSLDDWSGEYLIVNETNGKAFNGSLTTLDANNNVIDVTIKNNVIEASDETNSAKFTIAPYSTGYSIQSNSGKYIGETTYDNDLDESADTKYVNTISFSSGTVSIKGTGNSSGTYVALKYNSSASRFRYYKSGQSDIALYKKGSGVNYTSYITTCCTSWTAPTLTYTTPLNAETSQTAQPQLGSGTTYGNATYTSSNPSVLAVDEETGEVTAVSKGTATITVTWEGNETYCSISATSNTITVNGSYSVTFHSNGGTGTMEPQKADPSTQRIAKLNKNEFTKADYVFVGWKDASGVAYTDEQENITLTKNITLFAQWAPIVTLNDAGNEETAHPTTVNGTITLPNGENACDPYEFVGWTTVATGDWNEGINEPALVATTYTPNAPTTLYAVYKIQSEGNANAFKLSYDLSGTTWYVGSQNYDPYIKGYSNITADYAVTFYKEKIENNTEKYWVYFERYDSYYDETTKEYLYVYDNDEINTTNAPSETQGWIITKLADGTYEFQSIGYSTKYLSFTDSGYSTDHSVDTRKTFNLLPAVSSTYYAIPDCDIEIKITFEPGNGGFVANIPETNPLVVTPGETITLPTCEYPGYEFLGWLKNTEQLEMSDMIADYYTGEYVVNDTRDVIFYAYYKVTPEEVEFTGLDDAELKMYHYNGVDNYYYANAFVGEHAELAGIERCYDATTWKFTNVGYMQYYIQDEAGKYLGAYSDGDNDLILSATPKVWTFTEVNGLWKMVCQDSPSRALMYISTGKTFANAAITNEGNGAYSYVTLGICPDPGYTTRPVPTQGFTITNTVKVTSASGQKIKAASALTLETRNIELPCTFTITAPNITFYDNTGAEVTQLTASAASEQFELYFAYQPTAENTMEYPTVTIVDDELKTHTIKNRIQARSLPNTFAVVAKVGGIWYALPSQGLNSADALVGYPVEVDNLADPTAVTAVPTNADWSLRGVYEASRSDATKDRFVANGENLVFVNNEGTPKALNASASGNYLLTDAQYSGYYETNPGLYEWTPTTSDLETYTLTNAQRTDRTLNVSINTVFGVHYDNKATTEVRFLPIQGRYTPMALQAVEWKENSVVVMYNGDPAQTASVSVNGGSAQTTTLSSAQKDIAVYELTADGLATNPTQSLSITIGSEKVILPIPYIVSGEKTDLALLPGATVAARQEVAKVADLVVLKDAKLTADGAKGNPYKFRNVTIYGGGKLVIPSEPEEKGFGVASLTLRIGGVTADRNYDYVYPEFVLNTTADGAYTNTSGKINLDYVTTKEQYYTFVAPFDVNTKDIKYPVDIYGSNVAANNTGSYEFQYYDGAERAAGNTGWMVVNEDPNGDGEYEGATLTAGQGYTFLGMPKKVSVNGGTSTRQKFGIHRIPMTVTAAKAMSHENSEQSITVAPYPSEKNNNSGWNLIGNPYMSTIGGLTNDDIQVGKLVHINDAQGNWTGKWQWDDTNPTTGQRFLVIPSNDGQSYEAAQASNATLPAFKNFFVQIDSESDVNALSIPRNTPQAQLLAPVRRTAEEIAQDIELAIVLEQDATHSDQMDFLINEIYSAEFDRNADFTKMLNATNLNLYGVHPYDNLSFVAIDSITARGSVAIGYQVPQAGEYTLRMSDKPYVMFDKIEALYVTDHAMSPELTVDLMNAPYEFSVNQAETNNERFTVSVILKVEEDDNSGDGNGDENGDENGDDTTGVDNTTIHNRPYKFIYKNKIYILHNGVIYNAMGTQIQTINK